MADKVVKMQVMLTNGTILDAGRFTVPEGPPGPEGPKGPAGKDGVTPLMVTSTVIADTKPVINVQTTIPVASFNRTPLAGEKAVVFFIYSNTRYFIATVQVESVTGALVSNKILSAWELGIGIAAVSVTEVS